MADISGQRLGQYFLKKRLGSGGFADVYLAEHELLKQDVAIKLLHTQLLQNVLDCFIKEARIIASLHHRNIIHVRDFGIDPQTNTFYLVMDYAPNGSLRDRHRAGSKLSLNTIVGYVDEVADALQHVHNTKLIHCDVKPENMLLGYQNEVIVSDFGLVAVAHNTNSLKTQGGAGTIHYMAPEQIQGKARPHSDQYSLAIIVYEWLSGTRPFDGDLPIEIAMKQVTQPPPPLRDKVPTLPLEITNVVMKALSKNYEDRYSSIKGFAQALQEAYKTALSSQGRGGYQINYRNFEQKKGEKVKNNASTIPIPITPRPLNIEELSDKGIAFHNVGRYDDAIVVWNQILQYGIRDAVVYYNRGNAYFQKGQYQTAIDDYERAIQIDFSYASAYNMSGLAYYKLSRYNQALEEFMKAVTYNPSYAIAYYNRGLVRAAQGEYQRDRGLVDSARKHYQEAILDYDQAIRLKLEHADVYNDLGLAYYNLGDYYQAIKNYERALQLAPNHLQARNNIINAQHKLRQQR